MRLRRARSFAEFAEVLSRVMDWLEKDADAQWTRDDVAEKEIRRQYGEEALWVVVRAGTGGVDGVEETEAVGCMALLDRDEEYWPDDEVGVALYVHKLAVVEECKGIGVADYLIDCAKKEVRKRGCRYLRLDCRTYRSGLVRYYTRKGFKLVGHRSVEHGEASLFQMACVE
eukprot:g1245.t1